ncbi:MAG: methyltransferase [Oscillospiraceae bacterium]
MEQNIAFSYENIGKDIQVCISADHRFGTDAFLLADFAGARHKDNVLDLCAGNGIVGLLVWRNFAPAALTGIEIQPQAFEQMRRGAAASGLDGFTPVLGDLRSFHAEKAFDLVTCNPPYKADGMGRQNPAQAQAVARHELLCTLDDVCVSAARNLRFGGRLCLCNRPERLCDIMVSMRAHGIEPKRIRFVAKDTASAPWLVLAEGRKGGGAFLKVEPTLIVGGAAAGTYSEEMKRVYGIETAGTLVRRCATE